jgi:primosomal protein DnaI
MKNVSEMSSREINDNKLKSEYYKALKNNDFLKLVNKLELEENVAMRYTSKLETTVEQLNNCSKCKALEECKNPVNGCILYPNVNGELVRFDYIACKHKKKQLEEEKNRPLVFEEPNEIKNAKMADIDLSDKRRAHVVKWIKNFYTSYKKDKHIKGCYLHGSFGSGKSYMLAALINELSKNGANSVIIFYPLMLNLLKSSFNDDFDIKMYNIRNADILLIDDIGAETVTQWSRDEILGTILQYRMDEKLPTFFTSNLNIDELEAHLANTRSSVDIVKAKRIIERIRQLTDDLELVSENRRK